MSGELRSLVLDDLSTRAKWEEKQRVFYEMRHEGLRRKRKPFPEAADLHYPLIDGLIDKFKPFYAMQVFGNEVVASFAGVDPQVQRMAPELAHWFDYQLQQQSNFFDQILSAIDNMLLAGGAPMKVWWDGHKGKLCFDAIDPLFVVVPPNTESLDEADRITHVQQWSVRALKRHGRFEVDDDLLKRISGPGADASDTGGKFDEKERREGLTHSAQHDMVVVWEVYEHQDDGTWRVHTFSPLAPDEPLRPTFTLDPALYAGVPFVWFAMEIKDKGLLASRGIAERGGPFEAYLCRVWNEKADAMTFHSRPIFTGPIGIGENLGSRQLRPGELVPGNIQRVDMGNVPFDFDQEMLSTRSTAEQLFATPDFGLGRKGNQRDSKTATEVQHLASLMAMATDLRSLVFRRALSELYRKAWAILRVKRADQLDYFVGREARKLPPEVFAGQWDIQPDGSPDGWNKERRRMRAFERFQVLFGKPYVDQAALVRHVLEEDDPRLAKELFQEPQVAAATQAEDQAQEILLLEAGFPAQVQETDDHNVHLQTLVARLQQHAQENTPLKPGAAQMLALHIDAHLQVLDQTDKKTAAAWREQMAPYLSVLGQFVQPGMSAGQAGATGAAMPAPAEAEDLV